MTLDEYLSAKGMSQTEFGAKLNPPAGQSLVSQWVCGATQVTLTRALEIEKITGGDVTAEDCAVMGDRGKRGERGERTAA